MPSQSRRVDGLRKMLPSTTVLHIKMKLTLYSKRLKKGLRVTVSKLISSTIMGASILVLMLSVGCMLALFPVLFISAAFDVEFDVLFVWLGMPFSILFAVSWFYRYADFAKLIIFRR